jgi:ABC-type amino acid transport substrate-binding protein
MIRSVTVLIPVALLLFISVFASAKETVHVALTSIQPPFVFDDAINSGLIRDLITEMNRVQNEFEFELVLFPPSRAVKYFKTLDVDIIALNDIHWGWDKLGGIGSLSLTQGRDVFFSFKNNATKKRQESSIAAVRGFHYKFNDFDPAKLENNPLINLLKNEADVVTFMSYGRAEKGISSEAYLKWLALSKPELFNNITLLKEDHTYNRRFIVMPRSVVSLDTINNILLKLKANDLLDRIFSRYGQAPPPLK